MPYAVFLVTGKLTGIWRYVQLYAETIWRNVFIYRLPSPGPRAGSSLADGIKGGQLGKDVFYRLPSNLSPSGVLSSAPGSYRLEGAPFGVAPV